MVAEQAKRLLCEGISRGGVGELSTLSFFIESSQND